MIDDSKQYVHDRLNELETMLSQMNEIVLDLSLVTARSDERESLPDDTPVGHGWITATQDSDLFKPNSNGQFTWWIDNVSEWGNSGNWEEWNLYDARPATVGDLRRVNLPLSEWPDIAAPEPESEVEPEEVTSESDDPYPDWGDGDIRISPYGDIAKRYGDNIFFFGSAHGFSSVSCLLFAAIKTDLRFYSISEEWADDINQKALDAMVEDVVYELAEVGGARGFIVKREGKILYSAPVGAWIHATESHAHMPRTIAKDGEWRSPTSDPLNLGVFDWAKN